MKIVWIVVGVLVLLWLGFLQFDRNEIRLELDGMNEKFGEYDNRFNELDNRYQLQEGVEEKGMLDKAEDKIDKAEDKTDKELDMPYEEDQPNQEQSPKDKKDQQASTQVKGIYAVNNTGFNRNIESVHAFKLKTKEFYQPSVVAFELE